MAKRLVVTFTAHPGKGTEFVRAWAERMPEVWKEPGCEQYEIFQSTTRPDTVVLLERWSSAADLDTHLKLNQTRTPVAEDLRASVAIERYDAD